MADINLTTGSTIALSDFQTTPKSFSIANLTEASIVKFEFNVDEAVFSSDDNDLIITIPGQGSVRIEDYEDALDFPTFEMAGGELVPGNVYLFAFNDLNQDNEAFETAAGASGGSSGAGVYLDDSGNLYRSIESVEGQGDPSRQNRFSPNSGSDQGSGSSSTAIGNENAPTIGGTLSLEMNEDATITIYDTDILGMVSDPDPGTFLSVTSLTVYDAAFPGVPVGTLTPIAAGTWTFTPEQDFNGDLAVSFTVSDGIYPVEGSGA